MHVAFLTLAVKDLLYCRIHISNMWIPYKDHVELFAHSIRACLIQTCLAFTVLVCAEHQYMCCYCCSNTVPSCSPYPHGKFELRVICAVGAIGYQGQQAHSQGFNMGSGLMGFGAGAVAGAALGELSQVCLCSLSQYSNYTIE